jgi:hypothetical protein
MYWQRPDTHSKVRPYTGLTSREHSVAGRETDFAGERGEGRGERGEA